MNLNKCRSRSSSKPKLIMFFLFHSEALVVRRAPYHRNHRGSTLTNEQEITEEDIELICEMRVGIAQVRHPQWPRFFPGPLTT